MKTVHCFLTSVLTPKLFYICCIKVWVFPLKYCISKHTFGICVSVNAYNWLNMPLPSHTSHLNPPQVSKQSRLYSVSHYLTSLVGTSGVVFTCYLHKTLCLWSNIYQCVLQPELFICTRFPECLIGMLKDDPSLPIFNRKTQIVPETYFLFAFMWD